MNEYIIVFENQPIEFSWLRSLAISVLAGLSVMTVIGLIASLLWEVRLSHLHFAGGATIISASFLTALIVVPQAKPSVVTGNVADLQPAPYRGPAKECLTVARERFCYPASPGGPIRTGSPVRVTHDGDLVYRLEIDRRFVPSDDARAVAAELAKQKHEEAVRTDPTNRGVFIGGLCFALVGTGLMSLWWKRAYAIWFSDPDSFLMPFLFRLFVATNLAGAVYRITEEMHTQPLSLHSAVIAVLTFVVSLTFAWYMLRRIERFRQIGE